MKTEVSLDSEQDEDNAMTQTDLLRLFAQTLNTNYNGDPIGLQASLNSVELLESIATADNSKEF